MSFCRRGLIVRTYKARDLIHLNQEELWNMPSEWHKIEFDNGETAIVKDRLTKLSVAQWQIFKHYDAPILKEYHLGLDTEARITSNLIQENLNRIIWGIHSWSGEKEDTERISKRLFEVHNGFYNQTTVQLEPFEVSMDVVDVHEVYYHSKIRKANIEAKPTAHGIEKVAYVEIMDVVNDSKELAGNVIIEGMRSGTQKKDGFLQAFGPRGFPTDIDSSIFPEPVMTGYIEGHWKFYDNMVESRSGTKALLYNKELLRDTEYFNRKMQLIAQYVARLHHEDCGGHLLEFPIMKTNLKAMAGTYYVDPEDQQTKWFKGNETHLIGTKVKIRNVLGCIHPDPQGICSICYGRLTFSTPKFANIGQVAAVSLGGPITSAVLSTKHTDATSSVEKYQPGPLEIKYLREGKLEETLYLREEVIKQGWTLKVKRSEVQNLADILMISNINDYPIESASELNKILLQKEFPDGTSKADMLTVSLYNRKASFSTPFLKYLKEQTWEIDERDNVVIDLSGYDHRKPFLTLPNKHVNMFEVMRRIQAFLHSGTESGGIRTDVRSVGYIGKSFLRNYKDPVEALAATIGLLNEKISINASHCSVLVYAMMSKVSPVKDYTLPKPGISGSFEKYNTLMYNRSLGGAMAFEKQHYLFNQPSSFMATNRNNHPYDLIITGGVKAS